LACPRAAADSTGAGGAKASPFRALKKLQDDAAFTDKAAVKVFTEKNFVLVYDSVSKKEYLTEQEVASWMD
jgi:hypothetical protein